MSASVFFHAAKLGFMPWWRFLLQHGKSGRGEGIGTWD